MTSPIEPQLPAQFGTLFRGRHALVSGYTDTNLIFIAETIKWDDGTEPDYNSVTDVEWAEIAEDFEEFIADDDLEDEDYDEPDYESTEETDEEDDEDD